MLGPRIRRLAVMALMVNSIALVGLVGARGAIVPTDPDRFAGMPTPEALVAPSPSAAAQTYDAPTRLYRATARLRPGTYLLRTFDGNGRPTAMRSISLTYSRTFYALAGERQIDGRPYVKLTSGPHSGWWVPAGDTQPSSAAVAAGAGYSVRIARGTVVGKRFLGDVTLRRSMWQPAAATYHAEQRARFNDRLFYLLSDGPLAGRWVSARQVMTVSSADGGTPSNPPTPVPTSTAPGSGPTSAPGATATPAPTASATARATATPAPTATATPAVAPSSTWKAIALIYRDTDVTFRRTDGSNYRLQARMSNAMYDLVRQTLGQTVKSVSGWSGGLAAMNLTIVDVPHPLTRVDPLGNAYWVGPESVQADMDHYAPTGSYDSIFVVFHPRDDNGVEVPIGGWGLTIPGGSWSNGAGFTSVITPGAMWWWTNSAAPEEVFIHEWLHQVIFFHQDANRMSLDLHAGRDYGYNDANGTWKAWYSDIMQGKVRDGNRTIGLSAEIWAAGKPTNP